MSLGGGGVSWIRCGLGGRELYVCFLECCGAESIDSVADLC